MITNPAKGTTLTCRYRSIAAVLLLAAITGGSTWIAYQFNRDIGRARARLATGSRVISTTCGPLEYAAVGSGPPVLSIHGAGGGFDQGIALGDSLTTSGYRVIAMSRFGYLRTPSPPHASVALQADAHACLLDALGIERAVVIGVSAGAPSALEFALRYPARCTALILQVPGWYPPDRRNFRRLGPLEALVFDRFLRSDFLFWALIRFMSSTSDRTVLGTPPAVVAAASAREQARVATILRDILPVSRRQAGLSLERQLTVEDLSKPLESISAPTLVISAADDLYGTYANAEFIARHIPNAEFVGYSTGGHMLVGHDAEVISKTLAFLRDHNRNLLPTGEQHRPGG